MNVNNDSNTSQNVTPEQWIAEAVEESGMKLCKISERTGVRYSCLQPSLKGRRQLRADEYVKLCAFFGLNPRTGRKPAEKESA